MQLPQKLKDEIRSLVNTTLYFVIWLGMLILIKKLVLAEYRVEFYGLSKALIGALILAKVVLILEHVPLGALTRNRPALVSVILRTALYTAGVFAVLILEKGFEGRHEYGGFGPSLASVFQNANVYHVWANTICVSGALLVFNIMAVVRRNLGEDGLRRMFLSPLPEKEQGIPD